jgi:hypothetical protein
MQSEVISKAVCISSIAGYKQCKLYQTGYIAPIPHVSDKAKANLKKGTGDAKRYLSISSTARQTFISRCIAMHRQKKCLGSLKTFLLTYHYQPTPQQAKKDINQFLTELRGLKKNPIYSYAYAIEAGTINEQLHFHFIIDVDWIDPTQYKEIWGRIRGKWTNNSVRDIRQVKSLGAASSYAAKYISKADESDKLQGFRRFSTSQNLTGTEYIVVNTEDILHSVDIDKVKKTTEITKVDDTGSIEFQYTFAFLDMKYAFKYFEFIENVVLLRCSNKQGNAAVQPYPI